MKFWIVMVQGTNGGTGYRHSSFKEAQQEADRLAHMPSNVGKEVYVMEVVGYCFVPEAPQTWHPIGEIPF